MAKQIQLPDGTLAEFPDTMQDADIERVLQQQFKPSQADSEGFPTRLLGSIGSGVSERVAGVRQAFASPEEQLRLGKEVERAQNFASERGLTGTIGNVIGRDVLGPLAAVIGFANPLGAGALGTAGLVGALQGYTTPSKVAQTSGERVLNAAVSAPAEVLGQAAGGLAGRYLERAGRGIVGKIMGSADDVPSPELAAQRVAEAVRGQSEMAKEATRNAYEAVKQAGETVSPQDIQNVIVPQLERAYQEVAPVIPKSGPLAILQGAKKLSGGASAIPVSTLESLRKEAVLGAMASDPATAYPYQTMRKAFDVAEQSLPNPSQLQQTARGFRQVQGSLYENPAEVARIVSTPNMSGEEILQTIIGAGSKGKAGASRVVDDVFAAARSDAPQVAQDLRQALVARAYTQAGEDASKTAKELQKLIRQNESLAQRILTPAEIKSIDDAAKGGTFSFMESIARPATYTGGGLVGLGTTGAALGIGSGAAPALAGLGVLTLAARQSGADATALALSPLMRDIGINLSTPSVLSRALAPTAGGLATVPMQGAFTDQNKGKIRIPVSPTIMQGR